MIGEMFMKRRKAILKKINLVENQGFEIFIDFLTNCCTNNCGKRDKTSKNR